MVTLCLAGREAEREFYGHISDGSDRVDHAMAREYLARRIANPLQPVAKTRPLPSRGATRGRSTAFVCWPTLCCETGADWGANFGNLSS